MSTIAAAITAAEAEWDALTPEWDETPTTVRVRALAKGAVVGGRVVASTRIGTKWVHVTFEDGPAARYAIDEEVTATHTRMTPEFMARRHRINGVLHMLRQIEDYEPQTPAAQADMVTAMDDPSGSLARSFDRVVRARAEDRLWGTLRARIELALTSGGPVDEALCRVREHWRDALVQDARTGSVSYLARQAEHEVERSAQAALVQRLTLYLD